MAAGPSPTLFRPPGRSKSERRFSDRQGPRSAYDFYVAALATLPISPVNVSQARRFGTAGKIGLPVVAMIPRLQATASTLQEAFSKNSHR